VSTSARAAAPVLREPGSKAPPRARASAIPPKRRAGLVAGVAVSATAVVAGGLLLVPLAVGPDEEDGTGDVGWIVSGSSLLVLGSIATLVTATFLAHHDRWDAPPRVLVGDAQQAARARLQRRRLIHTLAAGAGVAVAGGLAIGLGYAAASACPDDQDLGCTNERATIGVGIGAPLAVSGAFTALSAGILLALHRRHRHRSVAATPVITMGAGSLRVRF
jgi:hypothetical protein